MSVLIIIAWEYYPVKEWYLIESGDRSVIESRDQKSIEVAWEILAKIEILVAMVVPFKNENPGGNGGPIQNRNPGSNHIRNHHSRFSIRNLF